MSDDRKYIPNEDEYQFPNEEHVHFDASATDDAATIADAGDQKHGQAATDSVESAPNIHRVSALTSMLERFPYLKRVAIVLAVVVVAVIALSYWHHQAAKSDLAMIQHKPKAPSLQAQLKNSVTAANATVSNHLNILHQQLEAQKSSIGNLQSQLSQLNDQVSDSHQAQQQIAQALQHLTFQMQQLDKTINSRLANLNKTKHHGKVKALPKPITYQIKAIIPGRAWLLASSGKTTTVRVGDVLKNYGKVDVIGADSGRVLTSSGKVIGYGVDDN